MLRTLHNRHLKKISRLVNRTNQNVTKIANRTKTLINVSKYPIVRSQTRYFHQTICNRQEKIPEDLIKNLTIDLDDIGKIHSKIRVQLETVQQTTRINLDTTQNNLQKLTSSSYSVRNEVKYVVKNAVSLMGALIMIVIYVIALSIFLTCLIFIAILTVSVVSEWLLGLLD